MLGLPRSTEVSKMIPKTKFYENLDVSAKLKRHFIDEIDKIRWQNKISPSTMNVSDGDQVHEIEVIEIELSSDSIDESVLAQIDREIPYHILFVLTRESRSGLCIGYKEKAQSGSNEFKVLRYFYSGWKEKDKLIISIESTDLDHVYDQLIRSIANYQLLSNMSIPDGIERLQKHEKVKKQIDILQKQLKQEKQLNKQFELRDKINTLLKMI